MIFLYLAILLLSCIGICYRNSGNYIGREQCDAIKGIFILFVFIRHIYQYIRDSGYAMIAFSDRAGAFVDGYMGQLIVVMFLFYSGYGVCESIKTKGDMYVNAMPKRRILTTLANFDIAVCIFIITDIIIGRDIGLQQSILAMTGWVSVGNSNWYILCILLCYTCVYFVARMSKGKSYGYFLGGVIFVLFIILLVLSYFKQSWYYNTIMSFGAGCIFSIYRNNVEKIFFKYYWLCLIPILVLLGIFLKMQFEYRGIIYNFMSILFAFIVLLFTIKIKIGNKCLYWFGKHLFPLYIYQRIPMLILFKIDGGAFVCNNVFLYIILCFIITIAIASFYKYWQIKI